MSFSTQNINYGCAKIAKLNESKIDGTNGWVMKTPRYPDKKKTTFYGTTKTKHSLRMETNQGQYSYFKEI